MPETVFCSVGGGVSQHVGAREKPLSGTSRPCGLRGLRGARARSVIRVPTAGGPRLEELRPSGCAARCGTSITGSSFREHLLFSSLPFPASAFSFWGTNVCAQPSPRTTCGAVSHAERGGAGVRPPHCRVHSEAPAGDRASEGHGGGVKATAASGPRGAPLTLSGAAPPASLPSTPAAQPPNLGAPLPTRPPSASYGGSRHRVALGDPSATLDSCVSDWDENIRDLQGVWY